jgi:hypothetical protein
MNPEYSRLIRLTINAAVLITATVISSTLSHAECVEYRIVEHEDSVEAVCVGKPLTAEEEKARLAEEKKEQLKAANDAMAAQKEAARIAEQMKVKESARSNDKGSVAPVSRKEKSQQRKNVNRIEEN